MSGCPAILLAGQLRMRVQVFVDGDERRQFGIGEFWGFVARGVVRRRERARAKGNESSFGTYTRAPIKKHMAITPFVIVLVLLLVIGRS